MIRRLLVGFVVFAVTVIVVFEVPLAISLERNARSTALQEVQSDATSLGLVISTALERGDRAEAQAVIDRYARAEHAVVAAVVRGAALLEAGRGATEELDDPTTRAILRSADAGRAVGEEGSSDPDDDFLYAVTPIALQGAAAVGSRTHTVRLVVLVTEPAAALHDEIRRDDLTLALFGAGVLVVAVLAGSLLARSLTRPLSRIEATVAALGSGALSTRVPAQRAPPELQALSGTVNEMASQLEELVRSHRTFVADASHQLRTPLTALRLRLENLESAPGAATDELASAIAEADRLSHVVEELLVLARTDGSRPERAVIDLTPLVEDRLDAWQPLARDRGVSLRWDDATARDARGWRAVACPGHVEQILDNLLANALNATGPGGTVSIAIDRSHDDVEVRVRDTGHGMRAEERLRAFDRFWRSDTSTAGGTGLGLAIVAQLVRASGGTCWLDASPTGGIDAVVRLPVPR